MLTPKAQKITQENLYKFKSQYQLEQPLGKMVQESLIVEDAPHTPLNVLKDDEQKSFYFGFQRLIQFYGKVGEVGDLELNGIMFGFQIAPTRLALSSGEVCINPQLGSFVGFKYGFYMQDQCLYTKGELYGWWQTIAQWDERIISFQRSSQYFYLS